MNTEELVQPSRACGPYAQWFFGHDGPPAVRCNAPWKRHCDDNTEGWVQLDGHGETFFPTRFTSLRDAQLAALAIRPLIDWSGTKESVVERLLALGTENIQRAMIEALPW